MPHHLSSWCTTFGCLMLRHATKKNINNQKWIKKNLADIINQTYHCLATDNGPKRGYNYSLDKPNAHKHV